ncbi:PhzF family phenazine biosynthesis protein [Magnetospira sp. QH-2]|uniref:PhzF family phenazine biosynthesis protein n=1 Tax=Magnetospira sp. (strain QH-2) TaxID=1288970 RepID=UPI0003E80AFE|nr:PhzF family phenazine biosynthesis protein [Magnetospira sp. QH-2]CCQ73330.1 Conserved protein of unknown function [Magnetospira sp. QH-2]
MALEIPLYQVDAFVTDKPFSGNPAAVCPLQDWIDDDLLQGIALENNLSETAYVVPEGGEGRYRLRWFTPGAEVDLCGHATLATARVVFSVLNPGLDQVRFETRSGPLTVTRGDGDQLSMDFPALHGETCPPDPLLSEALGRAPEQVLGGMDCMAVYSDPAFVATLNPDMALLQKLDRRGVIVSAPSDGRDGGGDFVSRFFAPRVGVPEDPVTGSAHCLLAPYWAARLGKNELDARQLSPRGGRVICRVKGQRVELIGRVRPFLTGTITLEG